MAKNLHFGEEMQKSLLKGIRKTTDAIAKTLGPAGRTVLIQQEFGNPVISKDGWTVSKSIELEDTLEDQGAKLIKEACTKSNDTAGDGTTTTAVLACAITEEGLKSVSTGVNPISIKRGIEKAVETVVRVLKNNSRKINTKEEIIQVATISANNDRVIGEEIANAMDAVGEAGVVTVEESKTAETYTDFVEGMSFDRGFISPYFCTDPNELKVELRSPYVLVTDGVISNTKDILPVLEYTRADNRPLFIIAENVEGEALTTLILNNLRGIVQVCAIKAPGFGERRKAILEDIAILTGGALVTSELGMRLEECGPEVLGQAGMIKVDKDTTTIIEGLGSEEEINVRVSQIKRELEGDVSDYERDKLQDRLAKLIGGVAVIHVGATTELELKEKKHRVEDAICSTRSAIEEGIVPGGGATLCHISAIMSDEGLSEEEKIGYNIVKRALLKPIKQIAENAGIDGSVIAYECSESEIEIGYDAYREEWVNMFDAGIVDPTKVVRCAIQNAASVASLVLTSSCAITTIPEKKEEMPQVMQPMM